jgi:spermidine/putrescine transport system substrate-binding protein
MEEEKDAEVFLEEREGLHPDARRCGNRPSMRRGTFGGRDHRTSDPIVFPISRRTLLKQGTAGLVALTGLPALLAACGQDEEGDGETPTPGQPAVAPTPSGTLDYLGWEGYDLPYFDSMTSWIDDNGVKLRTTYIATLEDPPARLRGGATGTDLLGFTSVAVPRYDQLDLLEPIDESRLPNLELLLPLWTDSSDSSFDRVLRNEEGQLLFVPLLFQTPGINYDSERVETPPARWQDLLAPEFKGKIGMWNEPNAGIGLATSMLGLEQGRVPKDRLQDLVDLTARFVEQSRSLVATFGDLANQFVAGDIVAAYIGFPTVEGLAQAAGATQIKTNINPEDGNWSFWDGYGIPKGADNADTAYAFINRELEPRINAEASSLFLSSPVVEGAHEQLTVDLYPLDQLPEILARAPHQDLPPLESDEFVTQPEWLEKWTELTS